MAYGYLMPSRRGSLASGGNLGGSLFDLHREMNRLFEGLLDRDRSTGASLASFSAPALEVHQSDDKMEITAELPGVKEDDIELTVEDRVLTLRGEKRSTHTDEEGGYSERSYGRFERSIVLPPDVDEDDCQADFQDGVLTITLRKSVERQRSKRIPLGSSGQHRLKAQNDSGSGTRGSGGQSSRRGKQENHSEAVPRQQAAQESSREGEQQQS